MSCRSVWQSVTPHQYLRHRKASGLPTRTDLLSLEGCLAKYLPKAKGCDRTSQQKELRNRTSRGQHNTRVPPYIFSNICVSLRDECCYHRPGSVDGGTAGLPQTVAKAVGGTLGTWDLLPITQIWCQGHISRLGPDVPGVDTWHSHKEFRAPWRPARDSQPSDVPTS